MRFLAGWVAGVATVWALIAVGNRIRPLFDEEWAANCPGPDEIPVYDPWRRTRPSYEDSVAQGPNPW